MQANNIYSTPAEFKFLDDGEPGTFEGYGAVYGNVDSHGDVIQQKACADSLGRLRAAGMMPAMYAEHSFFKGGSHLPIGVWTDIEEDDTGLRVKGRISALDTDAGRQIRGLMRDGAMRGLSIAYSVPPGGAVIGKKAGEPKRLLKSIDLFAIDVVQNPSNALARTEHMKSLLMQGDHESATNALVSAMRLHRESMSGGNSPNADQRAQLMSHLSDAHRALTGEAMPAGMKDKPETIRMFEAAMRDAFGYTNTEARLIAEGGFKNFQTPRDGDAEVKANEAREGIAEVASALSGFSLPKF